MSTVTADTHVGRAAAELETWLASVAELSASAFGWHRDRHGDAAALHVLRRQAARLRSSRLADDGGSYTSLCLLLAAACRVLNLRLEARHWVAALRNVMEQRDLALDADLGVSFGSPAERFKMLFDDAIDAAGLGSQVTVLDEKNRKLALGLAVNWGLRALLAYAAEARLRRAPREPTTRDLAWIGTLVRQATTPRPPSRSWPSPTLPPAGERVGGKGPLRVPGSATAPRR
jgi:hypothetical protein